MPVTAGKNLVILDNSKEFSTGEVILGTEQKFACVEFLLLVQVDRLISNRDDGFTIEVASDVEDLGVSYSTPENWGKDVTNKVMKFPKDNNNYFFKINSHVRSSTYKIKFRWRGNARQSASIRLYFYPEAVI